jgi:hypothetical protein
MRSSTIEPGLLRVFRWFVAIRLGLLALVLWSNQQNSDSANPRFPEAGILFYGILLLLLVSPQAKRVLGRTYLPVALVLASLAPIIDSAANVQGRLDAGLSINDALVDYWIPFFLLFVPLLLIAWQYRTDRSFSLQWPSRCSISASSFRWWRARTPMSPPSPAW